MNYKLLPSRIKRGMTTIHNFINKAAEYQNVHKSHSGL